jgi:DNA-binding MarR family transcriptional regulator
VLGAFAPLSSNGICERTAMDKAKVSRAVASLLKRGLIERAPHATDQRLIRLTLSRSGRKVYEAIIPRARAIEAEVTKGLSKADITHLHRALDRIGVRLDEIESD